VSELALTEHARRRVVEFGLGLDVVSAIARRPDVTHRNTIGQTVCVADAHPDWTVVIGDGDVVVTVLRRMRERWEHSMPPARPARPDPSASSPGDVEVARDAVGRPRPIAGRRRSTTAPLSSSGVTIRAVDPDALRQARELADGDARRLVLNDDGSVTVLNRARSSR
jgi:hypothetical protein